MNIDELNEVTLKGVEAVIRLRLGKSCETLTQDCIEKLAKDLVFYLGNLYQVEAQVKDVIKNLKEAK